MKASHLLICGFAIFTQVALRSVHAESIGFTRTDSSNASANSSISYWDNPISFYDYDGNSASHNTLANSGLTKAYSTASGSAQFLGLCNAANVTPSLASTLTPNTFSSTLTNLGWGGVGIETIAGSAGQSGSIFQVQNPTLSTTDTIILYGTIFINHGATVDGITGSWLRSQGKIKSTTVEVIYDEQTSTSEANIYEGSQLIWTESIGSSVTYRVTTEEIIAPLSTADFSTMTQSCGWVHGGPNWRELILSTSAECSMTATGYDSTVNPPGFTGKRVYVQRIVGDNEGTPELVYSFDW